MVLYVDDLLVAGRNLKSIMKLKKRAEATMFEMSDCGELRLFLGMKIIYNREAQLQQSSQYANMY